MADAYILPAPLRYQRPSEPYTLRDDDPLAQGLVLWWPMVQVSGVTARIGRSPLGVNEPVGIGGATSLVYDDFGPSLRFNGAAASTNFLRTDAPILMGALNAAYTFACWAKFESVASTYTMVCLGNSASSGNHSLILSDQVKYARAGATMITAVAPRLNEWYRVLAWTNGNDHNLYLNGTPYGPVTSTSNTQTVNRVNAGRVENNGTTNPMLGRICDVRVWWGRVFTDVEARYDYELATRWGIYDVPQRDVSWMSAAAASSLVIPSSAARAMRPLLVR